MARWQPGTRGRLQETALELFRDHGFESTTVAEIAAQAEVTERTFYRYFADKREVLFDGQERLLTAITSGPAHAPDGATPFELAATALDATAAFFTDERRAWSSTRQAVIDSDAGLRERELLKVTALSRALADALRALGVPDPQADLAADSAMSVFRIAFDQWATPGETRSMADLQHETLSTLRTIV